MSNTRNPALPDMVNCSVQFTVPRRDLLWLLSRGVETTTSTAGRRSPPAPSPRGPHEGQGHQQSPRSQDQRRAAYAQGIVGGARAPWTRRERRSRSRRGRNTQPRREVTEVARTPAAPATNSGRTSRTARTSIAPTSIYMAGPTLGEV